MSMSKFLPERKKLLEVLQTQLMILQVMSKMVVITLV